MVGRTLKHYRIESLLGKGGMGTVFRARDSRLQRSVALKVLAPELTSDPDRRQRFFQEARSAAAITHPAIAQVYDVDEAEGVTFIAMELVEGQTVRQLILEREIDVLAAIDIAAQVSEALARAHEIGIVHRDIKSENIMVTRDGHAKILDFGLAKLNPIYNVDPGSGAEQHMSQMATLAQTQAGMVVGTLAYMSPEQARGRELDHRSDIFSLGVTLYEMATGQLPFSGQSPLDTMHAIAFEETRPITSLRQNLPPDLQRIISRCLRKRPEDRYSDARQLSTDLKDLRRDIESGVTRAVPIKDRLRESWESIRSLKPQTLGWTAVLTGLAVVAIATLIFSKADAFWSLVFSGVAGLYVYRRFRNRRLRLLSRFASRVSKLPEVRMISAVQTQITVVVDRAQAKIYERVNNHLETVNRKLFFGEPFTASVRDDVAPEEGRSLLQQGGVLYVREDVLNRGETR